MVKYVHVIGPTLNCFLRIISDGTLLISGYEIDSQGEEVQPLGFKNQIRIIEKSLIRIIPCVMNNIYGELEDYK